MFKLLFLSTLLLFQACSSKRVNERPNYNLTGKEAEKEYKKFELDYVMIDAGRFADEGLFTNASAKELKPLMEEVSPKSVEMLEKTRLQERLSWVVFGLWVSTIFIKDSNQTISPLYWWGAGAFLGYGLYLNIDREKVRDQFNRDLKGKFTPTVGYRFSF